MSRDNEECLGDRRRLLGASMGAWARLRHEVGETSWMALSGAPSTDFNIALCWGEDGRSTIERILAAIGAARVPSQLMVCGRALGSVQVLVDAGWACVGAMPFMRLELDNPPPPTAEVKVIEDKSQIDAARDLIEQGFGLEQGIGPVAIPDEMLSGRNHFVIGIYADGLLVGASAMSREGPSAVGWSFTIDPQQRGRGYGRELAIGINDLCFQRGVTEILCIATAAAEHLYRTIGFKELERWQVWSRRRWMLAGA